MEPPGEAHVRRAIRAARHRPRGVARTPERAGGAVQAALTRSSPSCGTSETARSIPVSMAMETVITNFTPYNDGAYSVAIDADGRIVAAGTAGVGGPAPRFAKVSTDITPLFDSARARSRLTARSRAQAWPAQVVRTPRSRCRDTSRSCSGFGPVSVRPGGPGSGKVERLGYAEPTSRRRTGRDQSGEWTMGSRYKREDIGV